MQDHHIVIPSSSGMCVCAYARFFFKVSSKLHAFAIQHVVPIISTSERGSARWQDWGPCAGEAKLMMKALLRNEDIHSSMPPGAIIRLEKAAEACTHSKRRRSERGVRGRDIVVRVTIYLCRMKLQRLCEVFFSTIIASIARPSYLHKGT